MCMLLQSTTPQAEDTQNGNTTIVFLPCLVLAADILMRPSGRYTVDYWSAMTSNYAFHGFTAQKCPADVMVGISSPSCYCTPFTSDRIFSPFCKVEPWEWETDCLCFIIDIVLHLLQEDEPVSLFGRQERSTAYMIWTLIRAAGWKHCAMPQKDKDARVFGCSGWLHLLLDSKHIHWIAYVTRRTKALVDGQRYSLVHGFLHLDGVFSTTLSHFRPMFWHECRLDCIMKKSSKSCVSHIGRNCFTLEHKRR